MHLPSLSPGAPERRVTSAFAGYDHNLRGQEGAFYDMRNLSPRHAPLLAVREKRSLVRTFAAPQGLAACGAPAVADGEKLIFNGYEVPLGLSADPADCPKTLLAFGAYLLVWPDKKYLNTQDLADYGSLGAVFDSAGTVTFEQCAADGTVYTGAVRAAAAPASPAAGQVWLDVSAGPAQLKIFSAESGLWAAAAQTYVKISAGGIGAAFSREDGVTLSGITAAGAAGLAGAAVLWEKAADWIVVTGLLDLEPQNGVLVCTQTAPLRAERRVPDLDFVTEADNRVWGCRYGFQDGVFVNELYACRPGDPKNWHVHLGVSTDSYAVSLGTDGPFTGAVTYLGYPTFFKENAIHRVSGQTPASFSLATTQNTRGVKRGCEKSLAVVDEALYYCSADGVCRYTGSLPAPAGRALGPRSFEYAAAGAWRGRYYLSARDAGGTRLFVYEPASRQWYAEDETPVLQFCACGGELYFLHKETGALWCLNPALGTPEPELEWYAETGGIGFSSPDGLFLRRLEVRLSLAAGARADVYVRYDDAPGWQHAGTVCGSPAEAGRPRSVTLPVRPRRCDHFALRLEGRGEAVLYSLARTLQEGDGLWR